MHDDHDRLLAAMLARPRWRTLTETFSRATGCRLGWTMPVPAGARAVSVFGRTTAWVSPGPDPARLRGATLEDAARLAATLIEGPLTTAHLTEHVARLWKEINFVHEIGETISHPLDLETSCQTLLELALDLVDARRGSIFLVVGGQLRPVASRGVPTEHLVPIALDDSHSIAAWVVRHGTPLVLNDAQRRPPALAAHGFDLPESHSDSLLCVPLEVGREQREPLGVLNLAGKRDGHFASEDHKLVGAIARQAAGAIHQTRLMSEVLSAERLREELRLASEIHEGLLPHSVPRMPGYEVAAALRPASAVGGDYYDCMRHGDSLYLLIADVAGHGLGAALLVSTVRSTLRAACRAGLAPHEALGRLNDVVADLSGESGLFATAQVVELTGDEGRVAGAAHPPALQLRHGTRVERLGHSGPPAGALADAEFPEDHFRFERGETIVLYTDGLLEEAGGGGLRGLEDALRAAASVSPRDLVERLVGRLDDTDEPADDRTVLAIHRQLEVTP